MLTAEEQARKPASFDPDTFTAGGLLSDVEVEFGDCHFGEFTYPNSDNITFAMLCDLKILDSGETVQQMWSVGDPSQWTASSDGLHAFPARDGGTFKKSSNYAQLMKSVFDAGFPKTKFADLSSLNGARAWVTRLKTKAVSGDEKEVLIVHHFLENGMPWEAAKRKKGAAPRVNAAPQVVNGAAAAPAATGAAPAIDGGIAALAAMAVTEVIAAAEGNPIPRKEVRQKVMKLIQLPSNAESYPATKRSGILAILATDEGIHALPGIAYDGAHLSLA